MAQYRLSVQKPISRGKGQSAIAKAAYNAREKITDERTGQVKNYARNKEDVIFSGIFLDTKRNAPEWAQDRAALWNAAVTAEKRKDAREAQEIILNLPHELTDQQRRYMLTDFVREQLTRNTGRVVDVNIHRPPMEGDDRNYHAHLLMTLREIGPDGFGKRLPEMNPEQIERLREGWAERGAKELRKAGFEIEGDRWAVGHLSLDRQRQAALERGDLAHAEALDKEPTKHRGPGASAMERKGFETDRGSAERETVSANQEAAKLKRELAELDRQIAAAEREGMLVASLKNAANDNEAREIMAAYGYDAGNQATEKKWKELQIKVLAERIAEKDRGSARPSQIPAPAKEETRAGRERTAPTGREKAAPVIMPTVERPLQTPATIKEFSRIVAKVEPAATLGKVALPVIGKIIEVFVNAAESLLAPTLTPEQIADGEKATERREAEADFSIDFSKLTAEAAQQRQKQENEREAERERHSDEEREMDR